MVKPTFAHCGMAIPEGAGSSTIPKTALEIPAPEAFRPSRASELLVNANIFVDYTLTVA